MKKNKVDFKVLNSKKISWNWIRFTLSIMVWAIFEEIVLSSSDLVTNFFANHITEGNSVITNFISEANAKLHSLGIFNHYYYYGQIVMNGVTAASQIYIIIISVLFGISYGIGTYTAQYFGAKKYQNLKDLVMFKILLGLAITIIFLILIETIGHQLISCIIHFKNLDIPGASETNADWVAYYDDQAAKLSIMEGTDYIKIAALSYPLVAISLAFITTLRETGRPFVSFFGSFIAFIFTILLNIILVEPSLFNLNTHAYNVYGCAMAIVFGKSIQLLVILIYILIMKYEFFPNQIFHLDKISVNLAFKKATIISLNELFWSLSTVMQVKLLAMYSLDAYTANVIFTTIIAILVFPPYHGIAAGISVLVGNNLGNNRLKYANINSKRLIWLTLCIGAITGIILSISAFLVPVMFPNNSTYIIKLAQQFIWIYAVPSIILMLNGTLYSILRSGGLVWTAFLSDSIYNWGITIPIMSGLVIFSSLTVILIFIIIRIIEMLKLLPLIILYLRKKWLNNLVLLIPDGAKKLRKKKK